MNDIQKKTYIDKDETDSMEKKNKQIKKTKKNKTENFWKGRPRPLPWPIRMLTRDLFAVADLVDTRSHVAVGVCVEMTVSAKE